MQTTALRDLTTPGMAQLGLFFEVIADIRLLDRPGTNDAAFRSGVRSAIAERLPPGPVPAAWPPARLAPGSTPADVAGAIAAALIRNAGPATDLLTRYAGVPVAIEITRAAHRALTDAEADTLAAMPGTRAYEREGLMTAGEVTVARTRLVLIPERLPGVAWGLIQEGEPAGGVLGSFGMRRIDRRAYCSRQSVLVDASAVLALGDQLIGTAEEHVTGQFCRHAASLD